MHSTSKGFYGECGLRGGFIQLQNFPKLIIDQLEKIVSISLCSNLTGQLAMSLVCNPPTTGEALEIYQKEKNELLQSLKSRCNKIYETLLQMKGVTPQIPQGAL